MTSYDVFISYSRKDYSKVHKIASRLIDDGFSVWIDQDGIESGDAFKHVIVNAIENSKVVLFFSSAASNQSTWTAKEIGVAIYEQKPIIPILLDHTKYNPEIKFDLINLDFIDIAGGDLEGTLYDKLAKTLAKRCGKTLVPQKKVEENGGAPLQKDDTTPPNPPALKAKFDYGFTAIILFSLVTWGVISAAYWILAYIKRNNEKSLWKWSKKHQPALWTINVASIVLIPLWLGLCEGLTKNEVAKETNVDSAYVVEAVEEVVEIDSAATAETYYTQGYDLYKQGDYSLAFAYFSDAANLNHAPSQTMLGYMYYTGKGVEADSEKSKMWYTLAAQNGDELAQQTLRDFF